MRDFDWQIISALHTHKNITKAANILFIAQPTLTKRIQLIEEELGVNIIVRNTKGVSFTPEGEYIAQRTKDILKIIDEISLHLNNKSDGTVGTIRIGVPNSYAVYVIPNMLKEFSTLYPGIKFDIVIAPSNEIISLVENSEINLGFARGTYITSLEKSLLSVDQIYLVNLKPVELEDLAELPQIDYPREPYISKAIDIWWNQHFNKAANIRMKVNHGNTAMAMVKCGLGYAISSDKNFFKDDPDLYSLPLTHKDGTSFTRKTHLYYSRDQLQNKTAMHFIDFAKAYTGY